jgi:site-specific recombinase XerD
MLEIFYENPHTIKSMREGVLGSHIDGFASLLSEKGHPRGVAMAKIHVVAGLGKWMGIKCIRVEILDEQILRKYLRHRKKYKCTKSIDWAALRDFLMLLRRSGVVVTPAPKKDSGEVYGFESSFTQYLLQERGLKQITIDGYISAVRLFLHERFGCESVQPSELQPKDAADFILRRGQDCSSGHVRHLASALRSYFRFLYLHGETAVDLTISVPRVAGWRLSGLPKYLEPEQINLLLQSCDKSNPTGRRNHAIFLLLVRLGLRAGELIRMELNDIDWDAGEIIIRGKGSRVDRLPIPHDVGEALAGYLRNGRPRCASRRVFVRMVAPHGELLASNCISCTVRRTLERAGIKSERMGAHTLRHSCATQMLRGGASLSEIGDILRHQHVQTTEIYAKVDLAALAALARPWPVEVQGYE